MVLQPADEDGDLRMRPGQAIDLMRREQRQDGGCEYGEPGEEPASIRPRHALPMPSTGPRQSHSILYHLEELYRVDGLQASQFGGSSR